MSNAILLLCDGCGQLATPAHLSRRLRRLEWSTRFRPVHIQTLLLGGISPERDDEFLYNPESPVRGEAQTILQAVQISTEGKSQEAVLGEFQKLGLMLIHALECPVGVSVSGTEAHSIIEKHLPATVARIRRSLRPKRVLLLSGQLQEFASQLHQSSLGCPVLPAVPETLLPSRNPGDGELQALRTALGASHG